MKQPTLYKQQVMLGSTTVFLHWVRAISIIILIASGFYIAFPFLQPLTDGKPTMFLQAYIRSGHVIFGFILIYAAIFRLYLYIFSPSSKDERVSFKQLLSAKIWLATIGSYLFISKHPHIKGVYNPLQYVVYFCLGVLTLLVSLSGVVLYANVYHLGLGGVLGDIFGWVSTLVGGLSIVREIHHVCMWGFMLFVPVHIYMVIWNSVKYPNGGADLMISGRHYFPDPNAVDTTKAN
ncbi:Ni/Fe-hydrogenase, b-type cytochrome subunit [Helicobacter sp. 11S02629-2]|uniref:Ni/Fe-hydrogenase, b-type cytochrome subunit n=1 Tax=Helicobacter sp. 11S02629-2 TaxID=1476195 RepID=UPI000BA6B840|nr:Ni/Fe-hydrogenase, b-type cytochrome subunit [Helicobacter sp. 11S02629-2]PAF46068.1 Ni/Fe-hydrogenase, b-type cytochrome subunit [Helicobacter sp. 11S02629-2]